MQSQQSRAELVCVHPSQLADVWPLIADKLRAAMERTDLNHTSDLEDVILRGDGVLWVAVEDGRAVAAAATVLVRTDHSLVCLIMACAGENRAGWIGHLASIERWAKAEGAAKVRLIGRKGWARVLPNYKVSAVVMERQL